MTTKTTPTICDSDAILAIVDAPQLWRLDCGGALTYQVTDGSRPDDGVKGYTCMNCDLEFATWAAVVAHMLEVAQ